MLGYKNVSITLKVYAKFIKENEDERLDNLSKIVPFLSLFLIIKLKITILRSLQSANTSLLWRYYISVIYRKVGYYIL